MLHYGFLLDIAIILLSTKFLGILTRKFRMPQVVGALLAGLILGPAMFNTLRETEFIQQMAELGVIVLMFTAGLETDITELKKTGKVSFVVALFGVLFPLGLVFIVSSIFYGGKLFNQSSNELLQNIFIAVIFTATSVSITVETLKELGKINTKAGNTILGAALIDDVLGVIGLTIIMSISDSSVVIWKVFLKIILFFIFSICIGYIFYLIFQTLIKRYHKDMRRFVIISFVFCLILSYAAEEFFGVADITGAFIAGLIISNTEKTKYINSRFDTLSYMLLSPIFFASIGIKVELSGMSNKIIAFTLILFIVALISKIIGCMLGAKLFRYSNKESFQVGVGMVSRGEVALIVASKGIGAGVISEMILGPIVIVVVLTTVITPVLLKFAFKN
ncbi:cation:proton antiporter [Clostridium sp.]|uniref:cation:proton antiporter n=1 Tax=Clostridium sp. TaxID=1506 RepID=UPI0026DB678E|nr:cation:proton antiporter [Clostridium sp.]MDO5040373.1 cation:proton antiporter [Clostridium sp.]